MGTDHKILCTARKTNHPNSGPKRLRVLGISYFVSGASLHASGETNNMPFIAPSLSDDPVTEYDGTQEGNPLSIPPPLSSARTPAWDQPPQHRSSNCNHNRFSVS